MCKKGVECVLEEPISISNLNDFIFCPISIYFHNLYGNASTLLFQDTAQINGSYVHEKVDNNEYSDKKNTLQGISVYCERYNLIGKIDVFNIQSGVLTERKKKITTIYDGYIFQLYAQCFALREMGYAVNEIRFYSYDDNKTHRTELPENNEEMFSKFIRLLSDIEVFDADLFVPSTTAKCENCIYEPLCDRSIVEVNNAE